MSHSNTIKMIDWFEDGELSVCSTCSEKTVPPAAEADGVTICLNCGAVASPAAPT